MTKKLFALGCVHATDKESSLMLKFSISWFKLKYDTLTNLGCFYLNEYMNTIKLILFSRYRDNVIVIRCRIYNSISKIFLAFIRTNLWMRFACKNKPLHYSTALQFYSFNEKLPLNTRLLKSLGGGIICERKE